MPQMKDKWGDIVDIPQSDVTRALNSGYTYVSSSDTINQNSSNTNSSNVKDTTKSATKTSMYNVKGYDTNNNNAVVYVKSGVYVPGVSATIPTSSSLTSETPVSSGNSVIDTIVDSVVNADIAQSTNYTWTDALQAEAKTAATKEYGDYYERLYESEEASLKAKLAENQTTYDRAAEDTTTAKESLNSEYKQALQSARRSYASSGLAYSSERANKESDLSTSLTKGLTAEDTSLTRTKEDVASAQQEALQSAEARLGTSNVSSLASQYGYTSPYSSSQSGSLELEKQQKIAEEIERRKTNYLTSYS